MTLASDKQKIKDFVDQLHIADSKRPMNSKELQQLRYYHYIATRPLLDERGHPTREKYYSIAMQSAAEVGIHTMRSNAEISDHVVKWLDAEDPDYGTEDEIIENQREIDLTEQQCDYLCDRFYQATSLEGKVKLFMRRQSEQLADVEQNRSAAIEVVFNWSSEVLGIKLISRLVLEAFSSLVPTVTSQVYEPNGDLLTQHDFAPYANTWVRPTVVFDPDAAPVPVARPKLWQEYLDRMFPRGNKCWWGVAGDPWFKEIEQQDYMEAWLAQRVCSPEEANTTAVILRGEQGTGKGYWMDTLAIPMVGRPNLQAVRTKDWNGQFNGDMFQSVIIHLEETKDTRSNTADMLKMLTTQPVHRANTKNMPQRQTKKHFTIAISSNHMNPIAIEKGDRRYFVPVWSTHREHKDETHHFFRILTDWLEKENGFQIMRNWLQQVDIKSVDFQNAPMTEDKGKIWTEVSASESKEAQIGAWMKTMEDGKFFLTSSEVQEYWRISNSDAQNYMKMGGYKNKRVKMNGGNPYVWMPSRLVNTPPSRLIGNGWRLWDRRQTGHFELEGVSDEEEPKVYSQEHEEGLDTTKWPLEEQHIWQRLEQGETVAINIRKHPNIEKTWRYVYCGRPKEGKLTVENWATSDSWGNPYEIGDKHPETGEDMNREDVLTLHKKNLPIEKIMQVYKLKGKALGCFCKPLECHCDYLAELANKLT